MKKINTAKGLKSETTSPDKISPSAKRPPKSVLQKKDTPAAQGSTSEKHFFVKSENLDRLTKKELKELVLEYQSDNDFLQGQNKELRNSLDKLEQLQNRYTDLYDFAPVGYFTINGNGLILKANLTGASMLSMERDLLSGRPFKDFVRQEDHGVFDLHVQNVLLGDSPYHCELRMEKQIDSFFYARLECRAIKDDAGNLLEIRSTVSDITERKLLEEKYQQKRAVLRAIIDATDVMLVYLDPDFNFVWVNPAYAESCQMRPEEIAGKNHFELYPNQENEAIFRQVRDTGRSVFFKDKPFEYPDQPDRGITYWDWSLTPHKNEADRVIGLVFSLRETTKFKQAAMELAESEERFRRIAETSRDIIFQMDSEGRFTYCSPAIKYLGYSSRQVIGNSFSKFVPENEFPKVMEGLQQVKRGESINLFEITILKADGSVVDCEISVTPVVRQGIVIGVQGIARDITERKRTEKALRKKEAQLQTVFDNMTEGIVVANLEGNLIQWNPSAIAIHGLSSEEEYLRMLPEFTDMYELSTEKDGVLPLEQWPMTRILRGETLHALEVTVRRLDTDWQRVLSYGGTLARDKEGLPLLAILTLSDITERKWVERQLLHAKQEWEKTFDSVPDLIAILDSRHRIIRANRAMAKRLGLSPGQCVGQKCFSCVHGGTEPPGDCPHSKTMKDGKEHIAEVYEEKLGGYFLVTTTPLFDEEGKIFATVHVARDITERKLAEEKIRILNLELQNSISKLEETNRELARSNWDLEQFVNIASHDLQEPLRTISSFMQLLSQRYAGQLDDKADTFINYAVEGTIHMQKLINDLLTFSRVGGGELRVGPIDLQSVLENMLLNLKAAIEENQAEIIIDNLPVIYADEAQIAQLLQNLIANSLKFRGEEAPRIRIFSERKKNEIVICVRDNGIGIDPQHVDRIFLIFQRLHRRGVYPGTGIGLAICKKIVERHGGRIWVESTTDQGSLFCFTLPEKKDNDNE